MGQYSKKGLYAAYDKKNKERDALDYYATPPDEVYNILDEMGLYLGNSTILEPCVGGGHMIKGIKKYINDNDFSNIHIIGTDIKNRGYEEGVLSDILTYNDDHDSIIYKCDYQYGLDFMADDYPHNSADYIIMNPPYSIIEPFVIRALEIANKGVLMLARLQFLEGEKRFEIIQKENPPTDVYVYVDRIACYKNGDFSMNPNSIQAYAWFYWDKQNPTKNPTLHYLRRANKKGK